MARRLPATAKDKAIVDDWDRSEHKPSVSSLARGHRRGVAALERRGLIRRVGRRLEIVPPHERQIDRGPLPVVVDIDGRPVVIQVRPMNDSQYYAAKAHDSAVYAAVMKDDDSRLAKTSRRSIVDRDTGRRYQLFDDGERLRDAAETGEFEIRDLYYSGAGASSDVQALLAKEAHA